MYPLTEMLEAESVLSCIVKQNWCLIEETRDPFCNNVTIPYGDAQWTVRVDALIQRMIIHFQGRADYSKIARCVQNADEGVLIYLERLDIVFAANSGMQPDNVDNGPYNMQLKKMHS